MSNDPVKAKVKSPTTVDVVCVDDIEATPIKWLWHDRIACGKLTLIAGHPGLGKSQITASLAAHVTHGLDWPDTFFKEAPIGRVLFLSAEDDPADTIRPRLEAAGADLKRCHIIIATKTAKTDGEDEKKTFNLKNDITAMARTVDEIGDFKLIIIDPISAYMEGCDTNNNSEVRSALMPLTEFAAERGIAVVVLTHFNKSQNQEFITKVTGSVGLVAAVRGGYAVLKDEKDPSKRYFLPIKNNIGNDRDGFAYTIEGVDLSDRAIKTSRVKWLPGTIEAHPILYPKNEKRTETNGAQSFLEELLQDGPKPAVDIFEEATGAGYSQATIRRAAGRLDIIKKKDGMKGGWVWSLQTSDDIQKGSFVEDNVDDEDGNVF